MSLLADHVGLPGPLRYISLVARTLAKFRGGPHRRKFVISMQLSNPSHKRMRRKTPQVCILIV